MTENITSSDKMSEETVNFLKIQRALIEFASRSGQSVSEWRSMIGIHPRTSYMVIRRTRSSRLIISHMLRKPRLQTERGLSLADCGLGYIQDYDADQPGRSHLPTAAHG